MTSPQPRRAPVVLVVSDQEWSARSLESILMPNGYAVLRAFTGAHGLERARLHAPDVVIVAQSLPDTDGLALCRAHHWAFDEGLFTLNTNYEVVVSPVVQRAKIRKFEMRELDGKPIHPPQREIILPHPHALEWHRENVYRSTET